MSAMHDVFISYSNKDAPTMELISGTLEANGVSCWYAPRDIVPGKDWREAIIEAISASRVFILIYSKYSNQSRQVLNEVTAAFNASCVIIPFRIDEDQMSPALSYYLDNLHWMDALSLPRNQKIDDLCRMVKDIMGVPAEPTKKSTPDRKPKTRTTVFFAVVAAVLVAVLVFGLVRFLPGQSKVPFTDDSAAIEDAYGSTVQLHSVYEGELVYAEMGFACFADNVIVTDSTLVESLLSSDCGMTMEDFGPVQITASNEDGLTLVVNEILAVNTEHHIAILSTSGSHNLPLMKLESAQQMQRGDKVALLGPNFSTGEYLGRSELWGDDLVTFSASASSAVPGSGGSPLMNDAGEVIGMFYAVDEYQFYAVPAEYILAEWDACS